MTRTAVVPTNLEMFAGDTRVLNVTVLDQDDAVVDITGASFLFVVMRRHGQAPLFSKTVGSGIVVTDAVNGRATITINEADTLTLRGAYAHQLELTDAAGRKTTILFGNLTIKVSST